MFLRHAYNFGSCVISGSNITRPIGGLISTKFKVFQLPKTFITTLMGANCSSNNTVSPAGTVMVCILSKYLLDNKEFLHLFTVWDFGVFLFILINGFLLSVWVSLLLACSIN